ncbi:MAG: hypothetical protein ABJA98_05660, partial [Acidobacteriota bacterium]
MDPADLDDIVDRELRSLPFPRAPHTLLPRVLAAVDQFARRPWYSRAWFTWPPGWQVASLLVLALLVAGVALLMPGALAAVGGAASRLAPGAISEVAGTASRVDAAINAGRVVWRALIEPLASYVFVLVALMCVACAAFGTALDRVAFDRT